MKLREHAHARAGDKGDDSIIVLVVDPDTRFEVVAAALSPDVLAHHFGLPPGQVSIVPLPALGTLTIVLRSALAGGVTRTTRLDGHGKTLSGHLLDLELTVTR